MGKALVARPFEVGHLQADRAVLLVQLLDAAQRRPLRLEAGQHPADPGAVDAVAALVRAGAGRVVHDRAPNRPLDQSGELADLRSEEHTSELQSLMRISYAVFCLQKKNTQ